MSEIQEEERAIQEEERLLPGFRS